MFLIIIFLTKKGKLIRSNTRICNILSSERRDSWDSQYSIDFHRGCSLVAYAAARAFLRMTTIDSSDTRARMNCPSSAKTVSRTEIGGRKRQPRTRYWSTYAHKPANLSVPSNRPNDRDVPIFQSVRNLRNICKTPDNRNPNSRPDASRSESLLERHKSSLKVFVHNNNELLLHLYGNIFRLESVLIFFPYRVKEKE